MSDNNEDTQEFSESAWPGRILWMTLGAAGILLAIALWMLFAPWSREAVDDVRIVVDVVTSLGLVVSAVWAGTVGVRTMKASKRSSDAAVQANRQAKVDSKNANRPYVGVSLEPGISEKATFDLLVKNYGSTIAKELTIKIHNSLEIEDTLVKSILEMFDTPRSLMPSQKLRTIWHMEPGVNGYFVPAPDDPDVKNETFRPYWAGMPVSAKLTLRYKDAEQNSYEEDFEVMSDRSGMWPLPSVGPDLRAGEPSQRNFHQLGQAIAHHIGTLRY